MRKHYVQREGKVCCNQQKETREEQLEEKSCANDDCVDMFSLGFEKTVDRFFFHVGQRRSMHAAASFTQLPLLP